jgi:hypothetical protein
LPVDPVKLKSFFPELKAGTYQAIHDISIVNELSVSPYLRRGENYPAISMLADLISEEA